MTLIDGTQLASAFAERLAQVLPEGFSLSSDGPDLWLDTPDGVGTSAWAGVVDQNPMDLSLYAGAAWNVLSGIQDGVSVTLREPWPLVMVGSEHQMGMPGAKVVDDVLELWYGDENAPAIRFPPIKLRH
jgi:hypothetical protein